MEKIPDLSLYDGMMVEKPEKRRKVLHVESCRKCPFRHMNKDDLLCYHSEMKYTIITEHYLKRTIPEWCPLEEDVSGINLTDEEREKLKLDIICVKDLADPDAWFDQMIDNIEDMIQRKIVSLLRHLKEADDIVIKMPPKNVKRYKLMPDEGDA